MNPKNDNNHIRLHKKTTAFFTILVLLLGAGLLGWWYGRSDTIVGNNQTPNVQPTVNNSSESAEVSELVTFTLPDGWRQNSCQGNGAVFVTPNGTTANCTANPISPVKIYIDPSNSKDCNQLQNVTDVKKHVCISLYINGHKSLKATTEYLATSSFKQATTINAYYIDTGKGVVKVEYTYNNDNQYQTGFDQLANSINVKN